MTENKIMTRARRTAPTVPGGQAIADFFSRPDIHERLVEAADRGEMPLASVSAALLEVVGRDALAHPRARQFCGLLGRAVLADEGFVIKQTRVHVRGDPLFRSGAIYERRRRREDRPGELLARILETLSTDELRWAATYIDEKLVDDDE